MSKPRFTGMRLLTPIVAALVLWPASPSWAEDDDMLPVAPGDAILEPVRPRPGADRARGVRNWDGEHPGPGGRRPDDMPLTPQERAEALKFIDDINPELSAKIKTWHDINPERVDQILAGVQQRLRPLMALKHSDPRLYELKVQDLRMEGKTRRMAMALRRAEQTDRPGLQQQLEKQIAEHFDLRQTIRQRELESLRKRIDELQKQLEARSKARDQLIERRVQELAGAEAQPDW